MLSRDLLRPPKFIVVMIAAAGLLLLSACTVHTDKKDGEKKVDIQTPFANLKVDTQADAPDTGLPEYPGARRKPSDEHEHGSANVNLSGFGFGLKLSVIKYESDDPPEKILAFYKERMKSFGQVLECRETSFGNIHHDRHEERLTCDQNDRGDAVELKAGTPDKQRIVAVKPRGRGSEFALLYLQKRGENTM